MGTEQQEERQEDSSGSPARAPGTPCPPAGRGEQHCHVEPNEFPPGRTEASFTEHPSERHPSVVQGQ